MSTNETAIDYEALAESAVDADDVEGMLESSQIVATAEIQGEPILITGIREIQVPVKNGQPGEMRTSLVASVQPLHNNRSECEMWVPGGKESVLRTHFRQQGALPLSGRWFKDVTVNGEKFRGWQFLGLNKLPDETAMRRLSVEVGAGTATSLPF